MTDQINHNSSDDGRAPIAVITAESSKKPFPIVGIGASAGGLEAFTELLRHIPPATGMTFVMIQHLDPSHASHLCEALAKATAMPVSQPEHDTVVEPDHVYVIPPAADLSISNGSLKLVARTQDARRPHLPIDFFLQSLALDRGSQAIGVVLSGTASDGTEGLRSIKAADGITFAQTPESAKFGDMPRSALNAGVVDYGLAIPELAKELVRLSHHPYTTAGIAVPVTGNAPVLNQILMVVRNAIGVDFAEYKRPTIERRMARRMAVRRAEDLREYLTLLEGDPAEVRTLYEDILIHVTSFFRDREVFATLESDILPAILAKKPPGAPIRVWVAGCSTGEEVYSFGIAILEALGDSRRAVQIFGSDLSEETIARARAGVYGDTALRDLSDERRRRYFLKTERGYKINKSVRDLCVFVQHDLARDPPFAKLDIVSCRNVLIYFDEALQKRIIPSFHYALNPSGYLFLGQTESISGFSSLFSLIDKENKIFERTALPSALRFSPRFEARRTEDDVVARQTQAHAGRTADVTNHLDRVLLARYAPPGVLINEKMEILQFRGQTGAYLQAAQGEPQNNVIKMARDGLLSSLRTTIAQAQRELAPARHDGVEVDQGGFVRTCNVVVFPLTGLPEVKGRVFVVLFEDVAPPAAMTLRRDAEPVDDGRRLSRIEHELEATREYLQSLVEEHGRTNDSLGSANEELVSGNEELQSMNEELETAKEELQSTNEELTTVNDELHERNQEVTLVNGDLLNLLATVDIPIVILDAQRRIRRFTPKARSILNVLPGDIGRPIDDIKPNIDVVDLDRQVMDVIDAVATKESEVRDREGHWYRMQIRPYKTVDNRIDGAILSLVDIDALKHHVVDAQRARSEAEGANHAKDLFLAVLGHELRTPLSSLLIQAQMLRRGVVTDPAKLVRIGERVERSVRVQVQLVDDLLDVSRIVAGKLSMATAAVDLSGTVREAVEGVSAAAQKKSIQMEFSAGDIGPVVGDPVRLQQIVTNLLTNAIKFTPDGGSVKVTVRSCDGRAHIEVRDTGKGIEPSFLPEVFNRFAQGDNSNTRSHGGLGLGLAIVKYLVEQHGGTVEADSLGLGKGATFSVALPLMAPAALPGLVAVSAGMKGKRDLERMRGLNILVVDDDLGTREAVAELLRALGANVRIAESAAAGMSAIKDFAPSVLLCDIAMPGEDGYSFIRRVRALGPAAGGSVPALALSALTADQDQRRALASGFQLHLSKPFDIESLSDAVVDLVERHDSKPPSSRRHELD